MSSQFNPGIILSIVNFIPIILYFLGSVFIIRLAYRNNNTLFFLSVLIGVIIVTTGGLMNAVWKINLAVTGNDLHFLDDYNLYFLGGGTLLIFIGVLRMFMKYNKQRRALFAIPFFVPTILVLTVATVGYLTLLVTMCFEKKLIKSGIAILVYMFICLVMAAMSSSVDNNLVHWITQSVNMLGSAALLYGTYTLDKFDKEHSLAEVK